MRVSAGCVKPSSAATCARNSTSYSIASRTAPADVKRSEGAEAGRELGQPAPAGIEGSAHTVVLGKERQEKLVLFIGRSYRVNCRAIIRQPLAWTPQPMEQNALPVRTKEAVKGQRHPVPVVGRHHDIADIIRSSRPLEIDACGRG